jgi:hypothetical protein
MSLKAKTLHRWLHAPCRNYRNVRRTLAQRPEQQQLARGGPEAKKLYSHAQHVAVQLLT